MSVCARISTPWKLMFCLACLAYLSLFCFAFKKPWTRQAPDQPEFCLCLILHSDFLFRSNSPIYLIQVESETASFCFPCTDSTRSRKPWQHPNIQHTVKKSQLLGTVILMGYGIDKNMLNVVWYVKMFRFWCKISITLHFPKPPRKHFKRATIENLKIRWVWVGILDRTCAKLQPSFFRCDSSNLFAYAFGFFF